MSLPDCMIGPSEPCDGYVQLQNETDRLRRVNEELVGAKTIK
jgi:hypothetical protein